MTHLDDDALVLLHYGDGDRPGRGARPGVRRMPRAALEPGRSARDGRGRARAGAAGRLRGHGLVAHRAAPPNGSGPAPGLPVPGASPGGGWPASRPWPPPWSWPSCSAVSSRARRPRPSPPRSVSGSSWWRSATTSSGRRWSWSSWPPPPRTLPSTLRPNGPRPTTSCPPTGSYRQTAARSGEPALAAMLEELERVLVEVAAGPDRLTPAALGELQRRIESRGLLFKIRVVGSQVREREKAKLPSAARAS